MESAHDEQARGSRLVLLIALVALAVTAAAAFGRVFQGRPTTIRLMVAAGVASLLAGALERRHVLLAAAASAVGLAIAVGVLVFPETTRYFLPTLRTWHAVLPAMRAVGREAQVQVAPALAQPPLVLAALTAVWTAAFASHSLAARARSPFLALLPPAALLAFAGVLLEDGARPAYTIAFLTWALALLFADGFRRVGHWGPVSVWHGRSRLGVGSAATTRSARHLAAACLGLAAFFPWLLPGFSAGPILQINGTNGAKFISIDPIVDIRPQLISNSPVELFTVQSPRAAYWRFLSLDRFDGRLWKASNVQAEGSDFIASGFLGSNARVDPSAAEADTQVDQRFQFDHLIQPWLPAAYDPVAVLIQGAVARYEPEGQFLVAPNGTYKGFTYQVRSELVAPTPAELDALPPTTGPEVARYTELPKNVPASISTIAHRIADPATDMYRKVLAVQDYLRSFTYDIRVKPGHGVNDILYFLTTAKRGYCEQFAGSMAVLLRSLGIPARVAVGFTPGAYDPNAQVYRVTSQNAHAWVEVLFPRYGWLAFEPTPTRSNPVAAPYVAPAGAPGPGVVNCPASDPAECLRGGRKPSAGDVGRRKGNTRRVGVDEGVNPVNGLPEGGSFDLPTPPSRTDHLRGRLFQGFLALVALTVLSIPVAKGARRRFILARAREPRDQVLAAFDVMTQRASDVGLGRRFDETPMEYGERLRVRVPALDGPLELLTRLTTEAAYAERPVQEDQARKAFASARGVMREIRRAAGGLTRVTGWFRLERFALPR